MDWSEDERRTAKRFADQSESEGKRPVYVPNAQLDNGSLQNVRAHGPFQHVLDGGHGGNRKTAGTVVRRSRMMSLK